MNIEPQMLATMRIVGEMAGTLRGLLLIEWLEEKRKEEIRRVLKNYEQAFVEPSVGPVEGPR